MLDDTTMVYRLLSINSENHNVSVHQFMAAERVERITIENARVERESTNGFAISSDFTRMFESRRNEWFLCLHLGEQEYGVSVASEKHLHEKKRKREWITWLQNLMDGCTAIMSQCLHRLEY